MPIYERFSKRKAAIVYDVVIVQGRKRIWHRGLATRLEAKRLETKLEAERDRGVNVAPSRITLAVYLEDWLRDYASQLGGTTYATYCTNLRVHVIPELGKRRLRDLTPKDVLDCLGAITAKGRSAKTRLNVQRVLSEALEQAVSIDLIARNVCKSVKLPAPPAYVVVPPNQAQLDALLAAADALGFGAICRTGMWTALRQSELLNLRWADVDLNASLVYVRKAKHNSIGMVVLTQDCIDLLIAHRIAQRQHFEAFGPKYRDPEFVFPNTIGGKQDAGGLKRKWKQIEKAAAVGHFRFHDLRHAHAAMLIKAGVHPKVIQERLRHKQISTTMDIYGHLMPGLQADAAKRIGDAFRRDG